MAGPSRHPRSLPDMSGRRRDVVSPTVGAPRHGAPRRSRAQCARHGMPPAMPRPSRRRSAEPRPAAVEACAGDAAERVSVSRPFDVAGRMNVGPSRAASPPRRAHTAPRRSPSSHIVRWIPESARWRILVFGAASAAVALYPGGLARRGHGLDRLWRAKAGRVRSRATLCRPPFVKDDGSCTARRPVMAVFAGRLPMSRVRSAGPPPGFVAVLSRRPGASRPLRAALRPEPPLSQGVPASRASA